MGRRKERRLAALSAAGRRVKLDLFAEPSGDLGDSSVNEVEGDNDQDNLAGVPISSSSSGKRQDNPLLLLGQYSDEELNEDTDERPTHAVTEISMVDQNNQVEEPVIRTSGNVEENTEGATTIPHVEHEELEKEYSQMNATNDLNRDEIKGSDSDPHSDPHIESNSTPPVSDPWTSQMQISGDVISGWKLVMHEETNQYYYWNTETGETSWEVPAILAQGTDLGSKMETTSSNLCTIVADGNKSSNSDLENNKGEENVVETQQIGTGSPIATVFQDTDHTLIANEHHVAGIDLSSRLLSYAVSLLQKLKNLERSDIELQGHDWLSKYIFEIELRISDFNALLAYGSSLLPFWMYSEQKLRGIECAIAEVSAKSRLSNVVNADSTAQHSTREGSELDDDQAAIPTLQNPCSSPDGDTITIQKEVQVTDVSYGNVSPTLSPAQNLSSVGDGNLQEVNETVHPDESVLKPLSSAAEDVDMDVDMEVDDEATATHDITEDILSTQFYAPPPENVNQPSPPSEGFPVPALDEEYGAPPPPDEEWIPPPPPDTEPVPPPPPDEPPCPTYPPQPTYPETLPHPYTEQYNMSYPVSGYEYYAPASTEVPSINYYTHNEGHQIAGSQPPQYFDPTSSGYSEAASVMVNPMEPLVYYGLPNDGSVQSGPVIGGFESSGFYGESGSINYHNAADQTGAPGVPAEPTSSLLPLNDESDGSGIHRDTQTTFVQNSPIVQASTAVQATATVQAAATVAAKVNPLTPLTISTSVVTAPTDADKTRSKAVRSKKRTIAVASSLRSNKKVSSLVDKWKAAKEELHEEEEDEPENPYELLERKRQKEIEKWRAQQIASGEAKENANFQPLGGDWRERVKRKRARASSDAKPSLPDTSINEKQQPDLTEVSKDLPSGWQAYWDESSKEVYYGNVITSQTTWSKPTQ